MALACNTSILPPPIALPPHDIECIVSMNDALQQYFFISGNYNTVAAKLGELGI
jgi:hypothetical protein